ncbi:XdhC family protein [Effusibacillus consociatus]|uniref:XdhC family protein n=1 Tax=Effusibacillus consociatus TaxID=1117041 RepID=A0ABV9PWW6_9BACL
MGDIHRILDVLNTSTQRSVLATIIKVTGSAYRKEGTCMLLQEDGTQIGLLSGGCLEADLAVRVPDVIREGISRTIIYDMRAEDDLSWGQGTGCNGAIHVLLEPVGQHLQEHLLTLKNFLDQGIPVTMLKKLTTDSSVSDYIFCSEDDQFFGEWNGEPPFQIREFLSDAEQTGLHHGMHFFPDLSAFVYIQHFHPKPRLVVFGAGPDAKPLVSFAAQTGYSVTVADWRPALCEETFFPDADQILVGLPDETIRKLQLSERDSVVIMTHNFQRDREFLSLLLNRKLGYLGILGSRERTSRLFHGTDVPDWIHSPAGLAIGAEGPEEVALSILAEIIKTRREAVTGKVALQCRT